MPCRSWVEDIKQLYLDHLSIILMSSYDEHSYKLSELWTHSPRH